MSRVSSQTTFSPKEMHAISSAQSQKMHSFSSPPCSPRGLAGGTTFYGYSGGRGKLVRNDSEPFDSGIDSGLMSMEEPQKPKLLLPEDIENHDSGYGQEESMDIGDDVETDRVATETRTSPPPQAVTTSPVLKQPKAVLPRRPVVNHKAIKMRANSPPVPKSAKTIATRSSSGPASLPVISSGTATTAAVTADLQSLRVSGGPNPTLREIQKHMHYFLPNREGDNGIHLAVIHSRTELLNRLLYLASKDPMLRAAVDEQNTLFQTPLHLAAHTQQTDMIRKLVVAGTSLSITDHKGNTPLHIVCKFTSTKCLDEILRYTPLKKVAEVAKIRNNDGLTCVHIAAMHSNRETLRKLKTVGVNMDIQDFHSGKTALHLAVERDSLADVCLLVESCEVDVNAQTFSGCTPLHIASGRGNIAIVAYLLSVGTDPDVLSDEGDTALDLAGSEQVQTLLTKAAALKWLY